MKPQKKYSILNKDIIQFSSLFVITIGFVYFAPPLLNKLYFLLLLVISWKSKKDYFWFAFVFILVNQPASLFRSGDATAIHRIPFFNFTGGISFSSFDIFLILFLVKAFIKGKKNKLTLKKPLNSLFLYLIFLIIVSLIYGMEFKNITFFSRLLFTYSLFISFPFLVYKKEDIYDFIHIILPVVFIVLFGQLYLLFTEKILHFSLIGQKIAYYGFIPTETGNFIFIRPSVEALLVFFCLIFSLFFLTKRDYKGNKFYLIIVLFTSIITIFLSATRSWIIMFSVFLLLYFLFIEKDKIKLFRQIAAISFIFILFYIFVPQMRYSTDNTLQRVSTIGDLIEGDITAKGTLKRIDKRLPKVLEGFVNNPIIGWGFSDTYMKYSDFHVGNFNMLLNGGVIGFLFFLNFWIRYIKLHIQTRKKLSLQNPLKIPILIFVTAFIGMLLLHFTSRQMFGYDMHRADIYFLVLFIAISDFFLKESIKTENNNQK
jgi:hypothetical protein